MDPCFIIEKRLYVTDLGSDGSESLFNITGKTSSAPHVPVGQGSVSGNTVKLTIFGGSFGKDQSFIPQVCSGTIGPDCATIDWGPQGCFKQSNDGRNVCAAWCAAWTPGCASPVPWYPLGMSFWDTFGDNMVLQMEPAAAAVYGVATPTATHVNITVTESGSAASTYTVQATWLGYNATHQPVGPEFAGMDPGIEPLFAWKALLRPTAAGGNYTLFAQCTGCTGTGEYSNATITNVTFGDVWHCSGQSNSKCRVRVTVFVDPYRFVSGLQSPTFPVHLVG